MIELSPEWGNFKFKGKSYSLTYDKSNKESFLKIVHANFLRIHPEEKIDFSKIVFNSNWHITDYNNPTELLDLMEERFKKDSKYPGNGISIKELVRIINE